MILFHEVSKTDAAQYVLKNPKISGDLVFGNKITKHINLIHPISKTLDAIFHDYDSFDNEISNAMSKLKKLITENEENKDEIKYSRILSKKELELNKDQSIENDDEQTETDDDEQMETDDDEQMETDDDEQTEADDEDKFVYFKLDKYYLKYIQQEGRQFSFKRFIIALVFGYLGQSKNFENRSKGHKVGNRSLWTLKVPIDLNHSCAKDFVEAINM